ncbi:type VI secretion system protein TssA [Pseudomonas sp. SDO524_S393]
MDYSEKLCAHYLELALLPCSQTSFAGDDMRFSNEYEALEAEWRKAQSIHGMGQPDWQKIIDISECLLRQHTKDLRVVVRLTWALHQRESYAGLLAGLGLLRHLCEHQWAVVYPEKTRTRAAAFSALVLRLEPLFAQPLSLQDQQPLFQAVLKHLIRLDELWTLHLGEEAPLLLPVRRQLAQRLEHLVESGEPQASGVIAQVKQAATRLFTPETVVDNEKDAHRVLRMLQEQARVLCTWWLRQSATDLRALRLSRTLAWLVVGNYPEADKERVTALRAPAPDKLKRYQERLVQGHHADLVLELEATLAGALFWFDGLHMLWTCLESLQAGPAMTELEVTFALLLQRLPELPEFRFHDGAPFAGTATRDWITLHVAPHLEKKHSPCLPVDVGALPWETALHDVMPTLRKEGLKPAVHALKQGMSHAGGERARFHWRLALARLCAQAGKHDLARIQLEHLDHELQSAGLDRWEPELALQIAHLLYRCCELSPQSHAVRERKEDTHRRLCRFDLEAVLE